MLVNLQQGSLTAPCLLNCMSLRFDLMRAYTRSVGALTQGLALHPPITGCIWVTPSYIV